MINCSLGDDGVPSYEDTCSFKCNTGYELTGSDTRTCQSNGSWSSSDNVCKKGEELHMRTSYVAMHTIICTCSEYVYARVYFFCAI